MKDDTQKWRNGEIVRLDAIKRLVRVHYSGLSAKYDENIDWYSERLQKQCKILLLLYFSREERNDLQGEQQS